MPIDQQTLGRAERIEPFTDTSPRKPGQRRLATGLGWFSIGLGLAEIAIPRQLGKLIGARYHPVLMRFLGAREIGAGIGILMQRRQAPWLWARVGGDLMDLALLGGAAADPGAKGAKATAATVAVAGVTALDVICAQRLTREEGPVAVPRIRKTVIVARPPEELYGFWHDFENLPRFMKHLESVRAMDERRQHWVAKTITGQKLEWDSETTEDRPGELIAWRSTGDVEGAGFVRFVPAPAGRGTYVQVEMAYRPSGGSIAAAVASFLKSATEHQLYMDLRRFKALVEAGEVPTTEGQPSGTRSAKAKLMQQRSF